MIIIDSSSDSLFCNLAEDCNIDFVCSFVDMTSTTTVPDGHRDRSAGSAGDFDLAPSPAASTQRLVKSCSIANVDSASKATVSVFYSVSGSPREVTRAVLSYGDTLHYEDGGRGWYVTRATDGTAYAGRIAAFYKTGTGADTVGYHYCFSKDGGFPGAWAPGTPGLGGRTTDGTTSTDAGCVPIVNAASGGNYATSFELTGTVAHFYQLFDILWVNSGAVVTTTTGQTVNSGTLPARDANGTTNGEGCVIGLLFTAAATNAAVINNATVTYTNSAGTGSRTATLANLVGAQIPATPAIGTIVWFQLAAGDTGVRSIQTLTLGTSLATGSVSLLIARPLATYSSPIANIGAGPARPMDPGIRIYNGTCAHIAYQASATTATTITGSLVVQERAL